MYAGWRYQHRPNEAWKRYDTWLFYLIIILQLHALYKYAHSHNQQFSHTHRPYICETWGRPPSIQHHSWQAVDWYIDHLPSFLMWSNHQFVSKKPQPFIRLYSERNVDNFKRALEGTKWNQLLNNSAVDICNEDYELLNTHFPTVRLFRKRSKDKKWITKVLKQCVKQKDTLYKKQLRNASMENITKYRKYKNILNSCLKQADENFYQNIFSEKHIGITHFWKAFGETLNGKKRKTNYKLQKLMIENQVVTDENDIVNSLNNYFCSIGQKLSSQIPSTAKHFESYLRNKVHETFFLVPVMAQEVSGKLKSLHPRKSPGPDNLLPKIIKTCADQFTTPLTMLLN